MKVSKLIGHQNPGRDVTGGHVAKQALAVIGSSGSSHLGPLLHSCCHASRGLVCCDKNVLR